MKNLGNTLEDVTLKMYGEVGKIKGNLKKSRCERSPYERFGTERFSQFFDDRQKNLTAHIKL
ncbi:MAG: hypothetical protein L6V93_09685 [Clostridiales bacterium]|nr:MAG: hypothetical protein L6V93_09685 [Clostridiales bacterium]